MFSFIKAKIVHSLLLYAFKSPGNLRKNKQINKQFSKVQPTLKNKLLYNPFTANLAKSKFQPDVPISFSQILKIK